MYKQYLIYQYHNKLRSRNIHIETTFRMNSAYIPWFDLNNLAWMAPNMNALHNYHDHQANYIEVTHHVQTKGSCRYYRLLWLKRFRRHRNITNTMMTDCNAIHHSFEYLISDNPIQFVSNADCSEFVQYIRWQERISRAGKRKYIPQNTVWCNQISMPHIPFSATKVFI